MAELHFINITRKRYGETKNTVSDNCMFSKIDMVGMLEMRQHCGLDFNITCRYGLTDVHVPSDCPLRKKEVTVKIGLKVIKEKEATDA